MLSALLYRLDAFLEASDAVKIISRWEWPRCVITDKKARWMKNGTESPCSYEDFRIKDVYMNKDTREFYITFRKVAYSVTPVLPKEVNNLSIWEIELEDNELKPTLTIFHTSFQMTRVTGLLPWQEPADPKKTRPGYQLQFQDCSYS